MSGTPTSLPEPGLDARLPADEAGMAALVAQIRSWGTGLGFDAIRIADIDLSHAEDGLRTWLAQGFHGDMDYMANHGMLRARPAELVAGTVRAIVARMPYVPHRGAAPAAGDDWRAIEWDRLRRPEDATVSLYARGRDYHKVLRQRLQKLAERIAGAVGPYGYRVFTDSAPVLEVALATNGGLGWRGKHTLLLDRDAGSMFFLGEILIDLPLPVDPPVTPRCGHCTRCIEVCPTQAIVAPYMVDARRCISYLTIEHKGAIPVELRAAMGNHVYGCDDCQLACPWNKFAVHASLPDFDVRNGLDAAALVDLFGWTEDQFNQRLEGSPIRRIGHERWLRNLAVALGNALRAPLPEPARARLRAALLTRAEDPSALVREHVAWALAQ
ncbi:tRNA epoxyqueuosine(34) reductase QueG [Ralstonia solanacearum]|uniref:tRNA epoxyqueuosine(34) reductase QueG n=1 Tax=Ralstonia pseudosolanacearum TaxID=1310165 RepID=UPI000B60CBD9|nr:tRNA epoxyqueuosine(34) reductase QueG [Ralstonia pseudosolanacearum]QIK24371.1 tRNA epoxyqueuosine(34) reductase QueG [Ralstonia solanacearum]ASL74121.1 tRNA epoxyqueuosine(34) reductase QueG [Ralstonia pseudosolanacearum]MCK4118919.1 tRNA epoxyqueuosine(34) reductase QueG [Ralstonia pseudosolanacearum]QIK27593.1 tRNA epoxyqueuosine(34) reductase QueG [Ralstonia solanacearum]QIK32498.1 tRNA epoxyqueuosine(34) reductase QueG [Ralstonia solanacearum]